MSTDHLSTDDANSADGEGVWSPEIEQSFQEALILFPPCGRRKHILQEEGGGKMYGRNELIARHIMMRTGKSRTRKQVSSHIQVLARRKAKADVSSNGGGSASATPSPSGMRNHHPYSHHLNNHHQPAVMALASPLPPHSGAAQQQNGKQRHDHELTTTTNGHHNHQHLNGGAGAYYDIWADRPIATQKIRLVEFSAFIEHRNFQPLPLPTITTNGITASQAVAIAATNGNNNHHHHLQQLPLPHPQSTQPNSAGFIRHSYVQIDYTQTLGKQSNKLERIDIREIQDKFPKIAGPDSLFQKGPPDAFFLVKFWADINNDFEYNIDDQNSNFGFSSHFETVDPYRHITCSTKACSYGLQVVEQVEKIYGTFNSSNGRYSYDINRSPMCEFMIHFIKKLRQLPMASQMNSVLENFTVLQVITSESTSEILLCLAYVFEVASSDQNNGPHYHVYKLTKD